MIDAIQENKDETLWQIFKKATKHFFNSKTNYYIFFCSMLGFVAFLVVLAVYGDVLFTELMALLGFNTGGAVTRAGVVDGMPKIAAARVDPYSTAANPPPAVSTSVQQHPTGMSYSQIQPVFDPANALPTGVIR